MDHEVDFVLHQAALGSVPRSINDPISTNEVNITGFLNLLEASKQNNVKRFIYAASSSTYGDSIELPKVEERIGKPMSPYAVTKYVNELYASVYNRSFGIETIGLRYFNVFGMPGSEMPMVATQMNSRKTHSGISGYREIFHFHEILDKGHIH